MSEALIISQIALWVLLLVMAGIQLALFRQIGVIHERIAPMGALTLDKGPKEGESSPLFDLLDIRKRRVKIGGANPSGKSALVFFLSPTCPVCKKMIPILKSAARTESGRLEIVLASDELGMTFRVGKLPYAVLIDESGVVRAKGLINTREHLESLIHAKEMGVASIQEYLHKQTGSDPM
jgi:thiol-disulfide isomerase/thioredoxin